jgi:cellulose synthase/poly-beta-1,6-N-acetylglucosamine synthase-like glycosyltransferase
VDEQLIGGIELFYVSYFSLAMTMYLVFAVVALLDLVHYRRGVWRADLRALRSGVGYLPISILVPAHNEQETIVGSVRSLLTLDYPEFEIIVISDGSTDATLERLRDAYALAPLRYAWPALLRTRPVLRAYTSRDHPSLTVLEKDRGGKGDALNAGINVSQYPLFCTLDADSLLQSDALVRIARAFAEDDRVVAAGGIIRVLNAATVRRGQVIEAHAPSSLLLLAQSQEYVRSFLTGRTALGKLGWLLILSGAFTLFRKSAVVEAGGYRTDTVTEDMEIIVRLRRRARERRLPHRITFLPDPVCWTQIPPDIGSLLSQRDRWHRGLLETIWMHRAMLLNPRYGAIGLAALPFYLLFEALGPLIEFGGYAFTVVLVLFQRLDVSFALGFLGLAFGTGLLLSVMALLLDDLLFRRYQSAHDIAKLMAGAILEFCGYRQLLTIRRILAFFAVRDRGRGWGRIRRSPLRPAAERAA